MRGDFYAASRWLDNAGDIGVGSVARHVAGIPDVRYVKLAAGITTGRIAKTWSEIDAAAYMTLIWRPESSSWLVHAIGDPVEAVHSLRTSPGDAPPV